MTDKPKDDSFHAGKAAQDARMTAKKNVQNPQVLQHANVPNAGGQNREAGDRRTRQNDRATNGGE